MKLNNNSLIQSIHAESSNQPSELPTVLYPELHKTSLSCEGNFTVQQRIEKQDSNMASGFVRFDKRQLPGTFWTAWNTLIRHIEIYIENRIHPQYMDITYN